MSPHGWWYYYLVVLLLKTPLPVLILFLLAAALTLRQKQTRFDGLFLLAPMVVALVFFSSASYAVGVRYILPVYPLMFVLAGSLRDDGPLPETITDMNAAQDAYAEQLRGAGLVLCLGSMLHSIAVGNMLPSWVKIVCVDINPAVATKVSDRGTGQAVGATPSS